MNLVLGSSLRIEGYSLSVIHLCVRSTRGEFVKATLINLMGLRITIWGENLLDRPVRESLVGGG